MANSFIFKDQHYSVGDRVQVYSKIVEEGKSRTQMFEGVIIATQGRHTGKTFIVRKIAANNIGVERIIPLQTPLLTKIVLKSPGKVRRAKLYYLRDRVGRKALRVKEAASNDSRTASRKTGQ